MKPSHHRGVPTGLIAIVIISTIVMGLILYGMGRVPLCTCGYIKLWEGNIWGPGNSQHLTDWYTFSHIIHGFAFYYLFRRVLRKLPPAVQLLGALIIEAGWEILENSPIVIDRYRTTTSSVDYYGDSVLNSISDLLAMVGGYVLASRVRWHYILLLTIGFELFTIFMIRDGLLFNIIMLVYPISAIKDWQMQIAPVSP